MAAYAVNGVHARKRVAAYRLQMLVSKFFDDFYQYRPRVQSERTREFYRGEIAKLERVYGAPLNLQDLSEQLLLQSCHEQIKAGRSMATVQKHQTAILAVWKYATRKQKQVGVAVAPLPELERWPVYCREPECWSADELQRLFDAAAKVPGTLGQAQANVFWQALLSVCYFTGGRISAVMAAKWKDYDRATGVLNLKAENAKDRADAKHHLPLECRELLARLPYVNERIFGCWPYDKRRQVTYGTLNKHFARIIQNAGLPVESGERFHRIRRTFATYVTAQLGESVAQTMLGHSAISVTRRYVDRTKVDLPKACDVLPALKRGA